METWKVKETSKEETRKHLKNENKIFYIAIIALEAKNKRIHSVQGVH